jgi:CO/xanthine dehydrogenase FAD-binding subunit
VTRFRFLDGWRRKSGSNCLKTEEEPHKLIVAFNLPTRHAIFIFKKIRAVSELNVWEDRVAASFFLHCHGWLVF